MELFGAVPDAFERPPRGSLARHDYACDLPRHEPGRSDIDADVIVVGAGLAGLVAAAEAAKAGRTVILLDQEPETSLGGQALWSFGGLFFVDSPEQRRHADQGLPSSWPGRTGSAPPASTAEEDDWPRQWAEAYVDFAAGEKRSWLHAQGLRFFPVVGWAERGGYVATGHGNSVPRFHITWGTGPGVVAPFERRVRAGRRRRGGSTLRVPAPGRRPRPYRTAPSTGSRATMLEPSDVPRGTAELPRPRSARSSCAPRR